MTYREMCTTNEKRISDVPLFFAFSPEQFKEGCDKQGVTDPSTELYEIPGGGFIKKTDDHLLKAAIAENDKDRADFLSTKEGLISAFRYELGNHEYCITYDDMEPWVAVGLSYKNSTEVQREAFIEARTQYLDSVEW